MEEDTFAILKDFLHEEAYGIMVHNIMDFAQVLDTGRVILYKFMAVGYIIHGIAPSQTSEEVVVESYLIKYKEATTTLLVRSKRYKKFKEQMLNFLKEYPDFVARIEADEFSWETIPDLVRELNDYGENR